MQEYLIRFHSDVTGRFRHTISVAEDQNFAERLARARLNSPSWLRCKLVWVKPLAKLVP